MLQFSVWTQLAEMNIGASLQHYNPVIDAKVKELFSIPKSYVLMAEMPFGKIEKHPQEKQKENIKDRVKVLK